MQKFMSINQLMVVLFLFIGNYAFSQFNIPGGETGAQHVVLHNIEDGRMPFDCSNEPILTEEGITFTIEISVLNLDCDANGCDFPLVGSYPDMYVGYTIDGNVYPPIPVPMSGFHFEEIEDKVSIYSTSITSDWVPINCEDELPTTIALYQYDSSTGYSLYPINDFTGVGELFECGILGDLPCNGGPIFMPPHPSQVSGDVLFCCGGVRSFDSGTDIELSNDLNLVIAPNPFETELKVSFQVKKANQVSIELFDLNGKSIQQIVGQRTQGQHDEIINTADLNAGVYFIMIQSGDKMTTTKLIKI